MYTIICQGALSKAGGKSSMQCFITFGNVLHMSRKGGDNKLPQHSHFMKTDSRAQKTIELRKSWRGSLHCWVVLGTFTNCGRLSPVSRVLILTPPGLTGVREGEVWYHHSFKAPRDLCGSSMRNTGKSSQHAEWTPSALTFFLGSFPLLAPTVPLSLRGGKRPCIGAWDLQSPGRKDLSLPPSLIKCHHNYLTAGNSSGIFWHCVALFLSDEFLLHSFSLFFSGRCASFALELK